MAWDPTSLMYNVGRDSKRQPATGGSLSESQFQRSLQQEQEHGWRLDLLAPEEPAEKREREQRQRDRAWEVAEILWLAKAGYGHANLGAAFQPCGHKRLGQSVYPRYGA